MQQMKMDKHLFSTHCCVIIKVLVLSKETYVHCGASVQVSVVQDLTA